MKTIGEGIFAKDANGALLSRIGTLFFKTPGLVTKRGAHAMQRLMWIESLNAERAAAGAPALTAAEEEAEISQSVDLIFTDEFVLIRPDPDRMDLAFRADEILQTLVSKRRIRYLNTHSAKVRSAICARGENWRMARQPISQEDMTELVETSRVAICEQPVYYYNRATGTRYLTVSTLAEISALPDADYRRQIAEIVAGIGKRNRLGQPEIDVFPVATPIEIRKGWQQLNIDEMSDAELRRAVDRIDADWRMTLPAELREETTANFEWRNAMCHAITRQPNETNAEEQELVSGIAPEFYRQIEWLPGARIDRGEVLFDPLYAEAERTRDPDLLALCDNRVKSIIFNMTRLYGSVVYVNVGRIARSLARRPVEGSRRGSIYIVQYLDAGRDTPSVFMLRLQKWGVAERLDEGKDLLQAIIETDEYADYILDRRLMCLQLGMNLPAHIGVGHFTERYRGKNAKYDGCAVRTTYFLRPYVPGVATDKIPMTRYRNPAYALAFAKLIGEAAATDLVVGRRATTTGAFVFDQNYEVIRHGESGLPESLLVTDHAGSFADYENPLSSRVDDYASVVVRRRAFVPDYAAFARAYADAFGARLAAMQVAYRSRRDAFDRLFTDRPFDTNGSGAYRWAKALARLDACDPALLQAQLLAATQC